MKVKENPLSEKAKDEFEKHTEEAKKLLAETDKLEEHLQKTEKKLREIEGVGSLLGDVMLMISLVRSWIRKEYVGVPISSLIGIVAAILYVLSPIDLIPDTMAGFGYADDAAVVGLAIKMVGVDLELYREWRETKNQSEE